MPGRPRQVGGSPLANNLQLGEFEQLVLPAVLQCGEEAYGMAVRRALHERTRRDVAPGPG